jgi:hypothetical protein
MVKFYLVQTPTRCLPDDKDLTQIKGKPDGTLAICYGNCEHVLVTEKTFEETQTILDAWIDEENTLVQYDIMGQELPRPEQRKIDLSKVMEGLSQT